MNPNIRLVAIIIIISIGLHISLEDPHNPFTTLSNEERWDKLVGDNPNYLRGISDGYTAFDNNNTTTYINAVDYCLNHANSSQALSDQTFIYNMGIIHGYEHAELTIQENHS